MAGRPKHIKSGMAVRSKRLESRVAVKPEARPTHLGSGMTVRPTTLRSMPDQQA